MSNELPKRERLPSAAAERMRLHRERRRNELTHAVGTHVTRGTLQNALACQRVLLQRCFAQYPELYEAVSTGKVGSLLITLIRLISCVVLFLQNSDASLYKHCIDITPSDASLS